MRVYVETVGRPHPAGSGHEIERRLHERGHSISPTASGADVGLFVACVDARPVGVRAARRWRGIVDQVPHVVVTGCTAPSGDGILGGSGLGAAIFVPASDPDRLSDAVERLARTSADPEESAAERPARSTVAEILVSGACADACTYCADSGPRPSVALAEILRRVERARDLGA
ncbi:MAG TPA: hypothetical protein VIZ68_07425, partial [Thermoplasmata archaeon]